MRTVAFSLVELLIVIAIIGVLSALLFPAAQRALHQAKVAKCFSNLRQIGMAMRAYANDNNGYFPPSWDPNLQRTYTTFIEPYMQMDSTGISLNVYLSPFAKPVTKAPSPWEPFNISYSMHNLLGHHDLSVRTKLYSVKRPAETILVCTGVQDPANYMRVEAALHKPNELNWAGCPFPLDQAIPTTEAVGWPGYINKGSVNCLFVAGNVGSIKKGEVKWRHLLATRDN
jgi:prepilin-type N-terminal cleavage/methylation domain-containing protein